MRLRMLNVGVICLGALVAQAGTLPSKAGTESNEAGRLLKMIKLNAEQIRSSARNLENLSKQVDAKWVDYDQQWNMIKPAQERIDRALWRLENNASLAFGSRTAGVDSNKARRRRNNRRNARPVDETRPAEDGVEEAGSERRRAKPGQSCWRRY